MQTNLGGRRVAPMWSPLLLVLWIAACGGGGNDEGDEAASARVEASRVVVLDVHPSDTHEAVVLEAAQDHGAPGENERVVYRIRASDPGAAQAAAVVLRASGFANVEIE